MEKLNFVTNNVNGLSTSRIKRLKIFLHLQSKIKKMVSFFYRKLILSQIQSENLRKILVKIMTFFSVMAPQIRVVWQ